jgi:hypothetical protein
MFAVCILRIQELAQYTKQIRTQTNLFLSHICFGHTGPLSVRLCNIRGDNQCSIYSPTDALVSCLKNNFKIHIKIDIKTALTHFGAITIIRERIICAC